jgi:hypothetical protein
MLSRESSTDKDYLFIRVGPFDPAAKSLLESNPKFPPIPKTGGNSSNIEQITIGAQSLFEDDVRSTFQTLAIDRHVLVIEYAYGFLPSSWIRKIPWTELDCTAATIEMVGLSSSDIKDIRHTLRRAGLHQAGGGLRATGTDELFLRLTGTKSRIDCTINHFRWRVGRTIVWVRANLTNQAAWRARWQRLGQKLYPRARKTYILDSTGGLPLTPVNPLESLSAALTVKLNFRGSFQFAVQDDSGILETANRCHDLHKVWPISFSFPHRISGDSVSPVNALSEIVPGQPYSFKDPSEYREQYAKAHLALTHRKAGWDCFRHVEILSTGAIPLMIDAHEIPEFSMVHYPKLGLRETLDHALVLGELPDSATRAYFNDFFNQNLTSQSMASYMLSQSGLVDARSVLFVDDSLPTIPDYQSVLALIGLKQLLGAGVSVNTPVDYLYTDWKGDEQSLYGRGFGYTRVLDPCLRSESELQDEGRSRPLALDPSAFDAVVVGSIQRNIAKALEVLDKSNPAKTIWIHGEDTPPSWRQTEFLVSSKTHVFVRSIH